MATSHQLPNVSADLVWEVVRHSNSYLVKRNDAGGVQFSRDPLNVTNKHSRKHAGFVNDKAIGVQGDSKGNITLTTKRKDNHSRPAANQRESTFQSQRSSRKVYKAVAGAATNEDYRPDIRANAVSRASALKRASHSRKERPAPKPRGSRSKKPQKDS